MSFFLNYEAKLLSKTDPFLKTTFFTCFISKQRISSFMPKVFSVCPLIICSWQDVTLHVKWCSCWSKRRALIFPLSSLYSSLCRTLAQETQSVACSPSLAVIYWSLTTSYTYSTLICCGLNEKRQSFNPPEYVSCQTLECYCEETPPSSLSSEGC